MDRQVILLKPIIVLMIACLGFKITVGAQGAQQLTYVIPNGIQYDIELYNLTTHTTETLVDGYRGIREILWSPSGERLIFNANHDGEHRLYLLSMDTREVTPLTKDVERLIGWMPDGEQLLFTRAAIPPQSDIYTIDLATEAERLLIEDVLTDDYPGPFLRPDGKQILFYSEIERLDDDTSLTYSPNLLTVDPAAPEDMALFLPEFTSTLGRLDGITWTQDSQHIAFLGNYNAGWRAHVASVGGDPQMISGDFQLQRPTASAWHPDGTRLAFVGSRSDSVSECLVSVSPSGSQRRELLCLEHGRFGPHLVWSPDGTVLLYSSTTQTGPFVISMHLLDVAHGIDIPLPLHPDARSFAWRPR